MAKTITPCLKEDKRITLEVEFLKKALTQAGYHDFANIISFINEEDIYAGEGFKSANDFIRYSPKNTLSDDEKRQYRLLHYDINELVTEILEDTNFRYEEDQLNKFLATVLPDAERYAERQLLQSSKKIFQEKTNIIPLEKVTEWSLDEAIAWVLWRDVRVLEALKNDYIGAILVYPPDQPGYGTLRFGNKVIPRVGKKKNLLEALKDNRITARGRKNHTGDREIITSTQWQDLIFHTSFNNQTTAAPDFTGEGTVWTDIKIPIADTKYYFPAEGSPWETRRIHVPKDAVIISDYQAKALLREKFSAYDEEIYLWFSRGYFPCLLQDTPDVDGMVKTSNHSNNNFYYTFFFKTDIENFTPPTRFIPCKDVLDRWECHQPREQNKNLLIAACKQDLYAFEKPEALSLDATSGELIGQEQGWFYLNDIEEIERKQFGNNQQKMDIDSSAVQLSVSQKRWKEIKALIQVKINNIKQTPNNNKYIHTKRRGSAYKGDLNKTTILEEVFAELPQNLKLHLKEFNAFKKGVEKNCHNLQW